MTQIAQLRLMARYNGWMNERLYDTAATLTHEAIVADRGAFFRSILGTLEHLVVADTLWLKRFADHPAGSPLAAVRDLPMPASLDQIQFGALEPLRERRGLLDRMIEGWLAELDPKALETVLSYRNSRGEPHAKELGLVLAHFFNHQTHHRGQATTLLTQAGAEVGPTDLVLLVPAAI